MSRFCDRKWGDLAGRWHDLGKFAEDFQAKIRRESGFDEFDEDPGAPGRVDHSSAGAVHALESLGKNLAGEALAAVVAGHHCGLVDVVDLRARLSAKSDRLTAALLGGPGPVVTRAERPAHPPCLRAGSPDRQKRDWELWVRMMFSALTDADSLDTEAFVEPEAARERGQFPPIAELTRRLEGHLSRFGRARGPVAELRRAVQERMREAAARPRGIYTLTVPTGGGKTFASVLFALKHAEQHGLARIIVVPPFTSIIEQTAEALGAALGREAVVEHHSALDPDKQSRRAQLAAENWDAPVIVTTAVQLLESLFARKRSRCRKLHNLAGSVLVVDEAQTLPIHLLSPVLEVFEALVEGYGSTLVFSTATQPAFARRERFSGIRIDGELASDPAALVDGLRRVGVRWPSDASAPEDWKALAARIAAHPSVLAIVHRKADARLLTEEIERRTGVEPVHLSGNMCPAHRALVLARVRESMARGEPVRLVATQLVEAGVDLDFPVVFRALAGLDSLAQAAGRCNREGKLDRGHLEVFVAPTRPPPGTPSTGLDVTREMLGSDPGLDLFSPSVHDQFFRRLLGARQTDSFGIQALRTERRFRAVDDAFQVIHDGAIELAVGWGDGSEILRGLAGHGPSRLLLRRLQRFVVRVSRNVFARLDRAGAVEDVAGAVKAMRPEFARLYGERFGLVVPDMPVSDPETFVV